LAVEAPLGILLASFSLGIGFEKIADKVVERKVRSDKQFESYS
jgi:hypothetical protein